MPVSPPRPKGPPLNALRAFEAAARLGGFANAAEELCVTPGAISQHIKALEDWTGTQLFERRSQGVRLTRAGADLAPWFSTAFDRLGMAIHALRAAAPQPIVQIAALPSVAQLWLSPRLPMLRKALPHAKLSISVLETPPNLHREVFDLSLFIREPNGTDTETVLAEDRIFPVCAPQIAMRLTSPADLQHEVLLHDHIWSEDWALWATNTGHAVPDPKAGSHFSLYSLALDEAKNGAGVLMGHAVLVEDMLDRGELVRPFTDSIETGKALVLETVGRQRRSADAGHIIDLLCG